MSNEGFQIGQSAPQQYERYVATFMVPFADAAITHSHARPGSTVLDVACGTGLVTRRLHAAVAPDGRVTGVDINPHMLAVAAACCPPGIEWVDASAVELPLPDRSFDAVVCQQGLQFFSDRVAATREIHRVLKPGGRVVATIWAPMDANPYFAAQYEAILEATGDGAAFAAAVPPDGDRILVDAAAAASFTDLEVLLVETVSTLPCLEEFIPGQIMSTPWAPVYASLDDAGRTRLRESMASRLRPFLQPDGSADVPFASHLLVASRALRS